ncbi:hypothetical protein DVR12_19685 [Chitinophaga silvatica]|uniref:DUF6603 domain-containing protein n=1 Tax=Chitinophaga silvatica TaxID=2282649 RepID=A0A3E1Y5D9_9BACT|nr:DUF6603 domain-containing protein [Chitinophaga silvatica]RFS19954.1 hypothetical protein DVR12_19685 [Chitinophaga silvatica]
MSKSAKLRENKLQDEISKHFKNGIDADLKALPNIPLIIKQKKKHLKDTSVNIDADIKFDENNFGTFILRGEKTDSGQFVAYAEFKPKKSLDIGSRIPLVGDKLKGLLMLKKAYLIITTKEPGDIDLDIKDLPTYEPGISFGYEITLLEEDQQITLPVLKYKKKSKRSLTTMKEEEKDKPSAFTLSIQKQIGPILIDSISLKYAEQGISCSIDASMEIGPLTISLNGLSFGTSVEVFKPEFILDGLGIEYTTTALAIAGAAIRVPKKNPESDIVMQFDGELIIQTQKFGLSALASYAQLKSGLPSFFAFVNLNIPLGGPPFFMVTGLMGGLGFNRNLVMPDFNQVQDFPLMAIGRPQTGTAKEHAMETLQILEGQKAGADGKKIQWITPKAGDYWLATGVKFSSFEIIEGKLLLVAEFGHDLQFAVLGLAWLSFPLGVEMSDRFIFIELQIETVLKPIDGYFGVSASLTENSFLLTPDIHLTGDFSFNLWFGNNDNAGQFVFTAGGYHPAFKIPDHFPEVERLGFNWQISTDVSIKGNSYFAITPSCGMAGNRLELLFQHDSIKAWFTSEANFLVNWHPFTFQATIHIEVGVSKCFDLYLCHYTQKVSTGATLNLWGPPIGGKVEIHAAIVTISIYFGAPETLVNNQKLDWKSFSQLLPKPTDVCKINAKAGLVKELQKDKRTKKIIFSNQTTSDQTTKIWVVRAGNFQFSTQSVIPASRLTYGTNNDYGHNTPSQDISIRPMNLVKVTSIHNVKISKNANGSIPLDVTDWKFTPNYDNLAAALWGLPLKDKNGNFIQNPSKPSADTIDKQLTGYTIQVPPPTNGHRTDSISAAKLSKEYVPGAIISLHIRKDPSLDYRPSASNETILNISTINTSVSQNRKAIFDALNKSNIYTGKNDPMTNMAINAKNLFTDSPMEQA